MRSPHMDYANREALPHKRRWAIAYAYPACSALSCAPRVRRQSVPVSAEQYRIRARYLPLGRMSTPSNPNGFGVGGCAGLLASVARSVPRRRITSFWILAISNCVNMLNTSHSSQKAKESLVVSYKQQASYAKPKDSVDQYQVRLCNVSAHGVPFPSLFKSTLLCMFVKLKWNGFSVFQK